MTSTDLKKIEALSPEQVACMSREEVQAIHRALTAALTPAAMRKLDRPMLDRLYKQQARFHLACIEAGTPGRIKSVRKVVYK